ncbi:hypothetical protein [Algoriphagus marinus]|nr:hypothetical protein [Algoriphagus marinus]
MKLLTDEIEHDNNVTQWDVPMAIWIEMRDSMWPNRKIINT